MAKTPRTFVGSTTFRIECAACLAWDSVVTKVIGELDGVGTVSVDAATRTVTVIATRPVDRSDIATAVAEAGYRLVP